MSKIGVIIETNENEIKEANFGVITAARNGGANDVCALLLGGDATACKAAVESYGASKVVAITADGADLAAGPEVQAAAVAAVVKNFELDAVIGLSSLRGRDLLTRAAVAPLDSSCDLRAGPCTSPLPGGGSITFSLSPRSIPVMQPLLLEVVVDGIEANGAEVDFQGVDMNMGFNRPRLSAAGGGRFSGQGLLPVCVRDAMEWEARVLIESELGLLAAPFRFVTVKPGTALPGG